MGAVFDILDAALSSLLQALGVKAIISIGLGEIFAAFLLSYLLFAGLTLIFSTIWEVFFGDPDAYESGEKNAHSEGLHPFWVAVIWGALFLACLAFVSS